MRTTDADVIKAVVAAGIGVAVFQKMAVGNSKDIAVIEARHLFPNLVAYISLRRGENLRGFVYDFIRRFAPQWGRNEIEREIKTH